MDLELQAGIEAERAVLGSMMVEARAISRALLHLEVEDFKLENHRIIFGAIMERHAVDPEAGIDVLTVGEILRERGELDKVGGIGVLPGLVETVITADHVEHYARIVKHASLGRKMTAAKMAFHKDESDENLKALSDLYMARQGNQGAKLFDFRNDMPGIIDEILRMDVPILNTGFTRLDAQLCGIEPGELVTIGARTSGGKTAFMTRVCLNMAQMGHEVLYITSEMRVKAIVQRILPQAVKISAYKFRKKALSDIERERVRTDGVDILSSQPIKMLARGRISIDDIRRAVVQSGCKVVFVDYLQRCRFPKAERESSAIYDFMAEFKELLLDTQTIGFIASQLDRTRDREPDRAPVLADFRGSAGIESESDTCIMLWKPKPEPEKMSYVPPKPGCVRIQAVIGKSRNGSAGGEIDMDFEGEFVRFQETALNGREEERWS